MSSKYWRLYGVPYGTILEPSSRRATWQIYRWFKLLLVWSRYCAGHPTPGPERSYRFWLAEDTGVDGDKPVYGTYRLGRPEDVLIARTQCKKMIRSADL